MTGKKAYRRKETIHMKSRDQFDWVDFYREFADKLLGYKDDR